MFINEYEITWKKYIKWVVPKFYMLWTFYIYLLIIIVAIFSLRFFDYYGIGFRWKTLAIFMIFIAIYRSIFFKYLHAIKQFKIMKMQQFMHGEKWICKIIIDDKFITLYLNDKQNNQITFDKIKKISISKSFIALKTENENEKIMLDKKSFIKGNAEDFINDMKIKHSNILIEKENNKYNR